MEHTLEGHAKALYLLCRLCAGRTRTVSLGHLRNKRRNRRVAPCVDHAADIRRVFDLDIRHDDPDAHPSFLCHRCVYRLKKARERRDPTTLLEEACGVVKKSNHLWRRFDPSVRLKDCSVCKHYVLSTRGAVPTRKNDPLFFSTTKSSDGRPKEESIAIAAHVAVTTPPSKSRSILLNLLALPSPNNRVNGVRFASSPPVRRQAEKKTPHSDNTPCPCGVIDTRPVIVKPVEDDLPLDLSLPSRNQKPKELDLILDLSLKSKTLSSTQINV